MSLGTGGLEARLDAIKTDGVEELEEIKKQLLLEETGGGLSLHFRSRTLDKYSTQCDRLAIITEIYQGLLFSRGISIEESHFKQRWKERKTCSTSSRFYRRVYGASGSHDRYMIETT